MTSVREYSTTKTEEGLRLQGITFQAWPNLNGAFSDSLHRRVVYALFHRACDLRISDVDSFIQ